LVITFHLFEILNDSKSKNSTNFTCSKITKYLLLFGVKIKGWEGGHTATREAQKNGSSIFKGSYRIALNMAKYNVAQLFSFLMRRNRIG